MTQTPRQRKPAEKLYSEGGMDYLMTRERKFVTVYLPLMAFTFILLFPF